MGEAKERVPVEPFLAWCREREAQILREIDHYPAIGHMGQAAGRTPAGAAPHTMLIMELGWEHEVGSRRLHRWEHENQSTDVDRAIVEDALHHAGASFEEVYPDEPPSPSALRDCRLGMGRMMTDAEVVAAHTVYVRGRMTTTTLAEALWRRFGYSSPVACAKALSVAFRGLGLPVRQCTGSTVTGRRCARTPCDQSDFCAEHGRTDVRPSQIGGRASAVRQVASTWMPDPEFVERVRVLYVDMGVPMYLIGERLIDETPLRSAQWLAAKLAMIATGEGWYDPLHAGRRRVEEGVAA